MREILFRGKRIDSELWVEGSLVNNIFFRAGTNRPVPYIINPDEYEEYCCMEDIGELAIEVLEETVGQFTGLKDKNGKMIFEGDIVKMYADDRGELDGCVGAIFWDTELGAWQVEHKYNEIGLSTVSCYSDVITNIHDNPELLS